MNSSNPIQRLHHITIGLCTNIRNAISKLILIALLTQVAYSAVYAETITSIYAEDKIYKVNEGIVLTILLDENNVGCGLVINDGLRGDEKVKLRENKSYRKIISYPQDGKYLVTVKGKTIWAGLKSLRACDGERSLVVSVETKKQDSSSPDQASNTAIALEKNVNEDTKLQAMKAELAKVREEKTEAEKLAAENELKAMKAELNRLRAEKASIEELKREREFQKKREAEVLERFRLVRRTSGDVVYKNQCSACHDNGVVGSPKIGDADAWAPRMLKGEDALIKNTIHGLGAMAPQSGGEYNDKEIINAVKYMMEIAKKSIDEKKAAAEKAAAEKAAAEKAAAEKAAAEKAAAEKAAAEKAAAEKAAAEKAAAEKAAAEKAKLDAMQAELQKLREEKKKSESSIFSRVISVFGSSDITQEKNRNVSIEKTAAEKAAAEKAAAEKAAAEKAAAEKAPAEKAAAESSTVTIDAMDFSYALFSGDDGKGKSKESYLLDLSDAKNVRLINAFVYGKDTTSGSTWSLLIGDNTPRIICQQSSKQAKKVVVNLTKKLSNATVEGEYVDFELNRLILRDCKIK
jgi:cytochrome c5